MPAAAGDPYDALVELIPDRFAAGGEAIARDADGRVVFVNGALPGERVRVEITDHKRDWARARVVEVVDASPHRVQPPCPSRRAGCGGCGWQHMTHDAQRDAKRAVAADALARIGGLSDADVRLGASVDPVGYRTTVRVAAAPDGRAGFRAEHAHEVIAAPDCLVAHPLLRRAIAALELAPEVEPTLRCSVATGEVGARWEGAGDLVRGLPDGALVGAREALHERVAGTTLRVSMGSFFQSGPQAAELLVDSVRSAAPELSAAAVVVDAYAGIGLFAALAVPVDAHVIAIETSKSAVADARSNLAGRDVDIVRGEVGGWHVPADRAVDVVIADPARSGLGVPGVTALERTGAGVLVLVSCDPASLGRDAKLLGRAGYRLEWSEVVDTFPQTTHVEAVSRFTRGRTR